MRKLLVCAAVLFACAFGAAAQDWTVSIGTEAASQYLWRGFDIAHSPTIVPTITLNYEKDDFSFEAGYCSITELQKSHNPGILDDSYLEMDVWASATFKGITFMALEQGCGNNLGLGGYDDNFELTLAYELPFEKLPASISWNTFVLGDDYNNDGSRAFSSYAELNVPYCAGNFAVTATVGVVPFLSEILYETEGFAVTNLSLKAEYNFSAGDYFELPVYAQYTYNPLLKANFVMLGCTLNYTFNL